MTAVAATDTAVDPIEIFRLRCWARAQLFAEGLLDLHEAVDPLQADAEQSGLISQFGQETAQQILSEAFGAVRRDNLLELGDQQADGASP